MKKFYQILILTLAIFNAVALQNSVNAQCGAGFTQAQLNWDNLDYYNTAVAPYGGYVTNAMEQTQRFAIGTKYVTITTSAAGMVKGQNGTHTGDVAAIYSGDDARYVPTSNNQTITLTFSEDVSNVRFTLYDVDRSQQINFAATNAAAVAQNINVATYGTSILTISNNNATNAYITATSTSLGNADNRGTATITIAGPVKTITLTITNVGSDAEFWLSDINACVTGSFPTNWHQGFNNRPLVGPTQNQPDYFIVTPDNNSAYMMDPTTGKCWWLFTDAELQYINSFAYDPDHKFLYYVCDQYPPISSYKKLKRYNFNTEAIEVVMADITTGLNMPVFDQGVQSAAAAFYNGVLYLGIEGGNYSSGGWTPTYTTRGSNIWAIQFDASQNPINASQVMSIPAYVNGSQNTYHDWADFIIKNGMIYDFNTARTASPYKYPRSAYHHFNMMTGNMDAYYINPDVNNQFNGQAGMNWAGQLFFVRDSVGLYNENGTNSNTRYKAVVQSVPGEPVPPGWAGSAGDASDPFRPKCDFGDAPASYDPYSSPATQSPAAHERSELIRLGATWDREFWKRGTTGTEDVDDGLAYVPILPPGAKPYLAQVAAYNNSGANATLIAWLDTNGNGVFDPSEAITPITVPSSASMQNFYLYWPNTNNVFVNGQFTYLRIRITAASAGMTVNHPTGYFTNGEVEDYKVIIDNFPLATHFIDFNATPAAQKVKLSWKATEEEGTYEYQIERSRDNNNWEKIASVKANGVNGTFDYQYDDYTAGKGTIYYRIRVIESAGMNRFSMIRKVVMKDWNATFSVSPNPAKDFIRLKFELPAPDELPISIINAQGAVVFAKTINGLMGWNSVDITLPAHLPDGTYNVSIGNGEMIIRKKIVVLK
ncbi:MAG: T9SS type A sorting domain-containing protein [Bacteroidetes bacterium]|nr:T9SS type A sorting domain-containing protein [Bacteroidota bacterium]